MRFFVAGVPAAQPRPRARVVAVAGCRPRAQVYDARGSCKSWREAIHLVAQTQRSALPNGVPLDGPLRLALEFVFPRPKAKVHKRLPMPPEWKANKPDLDNLAKAVKDALNGVLWRDDAQVVDLRVRKRLASGDYAEPPGVYVEVEPAGEVG